MNKELLALVFSVKELITSVGSGYYKTKSGKHEFGDLLTKLKLWALSQGYSISTEPLDGGDCVVWAISVRQGFDIVLREQRKTELLGVTEACEWIMKPKVAEDEI